MREVLDMVRSGGIDALTIRSVAQALGVFPRLIYNHVRDKEDMLALRTGGRGFAISPPRFSAPIAITPAPPPSSLSRSAKRIAQPNALRVREAIFEALRDIGLERHRQEETLVLCSVIVLGNIVLAENLPSDQRNMPI